MSAFRAVIFDLDGVLADTARLHFLAWSRLAAELGLTLDAGVAEALKGVDRASSLEIVLAQGKRAYSAAERAALAQRKNEYYMQLVQSLAPEDLLPGAATVLSTCRHGGLLVGLASTSRNAALVIERLGLSNAFDAYVDGNAITCAKPHPEIFLNVAHQMQIAPCACIGVEDAVAGIKAIKAAGMFAVGVGTADALLAAGADRVIAEIAAFRIEGCSGTSAHHPEHCRA